MLPSDSYYVMFRFSTRIFYRRIPGFATDCPCCVWCHALTTCLLHVGLFLLKSSLKWLWICKFDITKKNFFIVLIMFFTYTLMPHNMIKKLLAPFTLFSCLKLWGSFSHPECTIHVIPSDFVPECRHGSNSLSMRYIPSQRFSTRNVPCASN